MSCISVDMQNTGEENYGCPCLACCFVINIKGEKRRTKWIKKRKRLNNKQRRVTKKFDLSF
jgi:hypothetical protein